LLEGGIQRREIGRRGLSIAYFYEQERSQQEYEAEARGGTPKDADNAVHGSPKASNCRSEAIAVQKAALTEQGDIAGPRTIDQHPKHRRQGSIG